MTDETPTSAPAESANDITSAIPVRVNDRSSSIQVTAAELVPQRSGILATAVDESGTPARTLTETTRVTVGGVQMPLRAAVLHGLLVQDQESGEYREPTAEERTTRQEAADKSKPEQVTLPDAQAEENLDNIVRAVQAYGGDPTTLVADFITDPSKPPKAFEEIARRHGTSRTALNEAWLGIVFSAAKQADATVKEMGLEPEPVWEWARQNSKAAFDSAKIRHFNGSLEGYRHLARQYMKAKGLGGGPGARRNALGLTIVGEKDGVITARMPGGKIVQLSSANARAQGLL